MIFVFSLFSEFHLGHYIGLVVLLGLSIDSISLFGERWIEIPEKVTGLKKRVCPSLVTLAHFIKLRNDDDGSFSCFCF